MVLDSPRDVACGDLLIAQESGGDPTVAWRAACAGDLSRQYAIDPPLQVAAVFVLQWYVGALARAAAHLAASGPDLPELSPEHLSIQRSGPGGYPVSVGLSSATPLLHLPEVTDRWAAAEAGFRDHADRFVAAYDPGVKLGSAVRSGSVEDAWDAARASADPDFSQPNWRSSCCFIYALPGVHECVRCPRLKS